MDDSRKDDEQTTGMSSSENTNVVPQTEAPSIATPEVQQETVPTQQASDENTRLYAIVGYIVPFLFFLPLLSENTKNDAFAKFHANQQLNLLLLCIAFMVFNNVLYLIFYFIAYLVVPLIWAGILVLAVMGILNVINGKMKELPVIGKFRLLK